MSSVQMTVTGQRFSMAKGDLKQVVSNLHRQMLKLRAKQEMSMTPQMVSCKVAPEFEYPVNQQVVVYSASLKVDNVVRNLGGYFAQAYFVPELEQRGEAKQIRLPPYASAFGCVVQADNDDSVEVFVFYGIPEGRVYYNDLCKAAVDECNLQYAENDHEIDALLTIPHPDEEYFRGFHAGTESEGWLNEFRRQLAEQVARYTIQNPISRVSFATQSGFASFVAEMVANFKKFVEDNRGWALLWNDDGTPRDEKIAQDLFQGIVSSYCKANNVDLSREVNIGRGPVDFKISAGYAHRALIELKLASNSKFWKGLALQLPTYLHAESVSIGFFVAIAFTQAELKKVSSSAKKVSRVNSLTIDAVVVNAQAKPPSASTL
jgi:hypothetical protein